MSSGVDNLLKEVTQGAHILASIDGGAQADLERMLDRCARDIWNEIATVALIITNKQEVLDGA